MKFCINSLRRDNLNAHQSSAVVLPFYVHSIVTKSCVEHLCVSDAVLPNLKQNLMPVLYFSKSAIRKSQIAFNTQHWISVEE
jgi:hypothetical protein